MHPLRWIAAAGATARREATQAARITICATVAWQLTLWLGASNPPVFAALVPIVPARRPVRRDRAVARADGRRHRRHRDRAPGDPPDPPLDGDAGADAGGRVRSRHGAARARPAERAGRDLG